jgi:hypothetical protein
MDNHKSSNTKRNWIFLKIHGSVIQGLRKIMFSNCIFFIFCDGLVFIIFKFVYRPLMNSFVFNELDGHQVHFTYELFIKFIYLWWNLNFVNCAISLNFKALINNVVGTDVQDLITMFNLYIDVSYVNSIFQMIKFWYFLLWASPC